jgi:hypothetical protein
MTLDLAPLVQALAALALAAITGATPYLAPMLRRYLHVQITATQAAAIQSAADMGAKAAYGYIATSASSYHDVTIRNAALATGVQHVITTVPDAMTALAITPDQVRQMVESRFGGLLATEPTVTISRPARTA